MTHFVTPPIRQTHQQQQRCFPAQKISLKVAFVFLFQDSFGCSISKPLTMTETVQTLRERSFNQDDIYSGLCVKFYIYVLLAMPAFAAQTFIWLERCVLLLSEARADWSLWQAEMQPIINHTEEGKQWVMLQVYFENSDAKEKQQKRIQI